MLLSNAGGPALNRRASVAAWDICNRPPPLCWAGQLAQVHAAVFDRVVRAHGRHWTMQELDDCEAKFRLATQQSAPEDALSQLSLGNGPAGRRPQKTSSYALCIRAGAASQPADRAGRADWVVAHGTLCSPASPPSTPRHRVLSALSLSALQAWRPGCLGWA